MVLRIFNGEKRFDCRLLEYIGTCQNEKAVAMLENVDPSNLRDSSGKSLLHWSIIEWANSVIIKHLIGKGCNVNAQDNDGNTALWLAVDAYHECAVKALIEANANIHIANKKGESPVRLAFSQRPSLDIGVAKLLLNKLQAEYAADKQLLRNKLIDLECPIYFAVLLRGTEITRTMLDRGCSVEARDKALHEAVAQTDFASVKLLVERGADVNGLDAYGYEAVKTPLHRYDFRSDDTHEKLEMLKFLIAQGASLSSAYFDDDYVTLMEIFMRYGNKETICTLLRIDGIDLRAKYGLGNTALHFACQNDRPGIGDAIQMFRGKDFDINAVNDEGYTALMMAVEKGIVSTVEALLEIGADANIFHHTFVHFCQSSATTENFRKIVDLVLLNTPNFPRCPGEILLDERHNGIIHFVDILRLQQNGHSYSVESILAKLAEMEFHNKYAIIDYTRREIRKVNYRKYFNFCKKSLEDMKLITVYKSITLFELLKYGISQKKLSRYARNQEFLAAYDQVVTEKLHLLPHYYSWVIQRRFAEAIAMVNLKEQAACVISKIIQLNTRHIVACEIVNYLDSQDLKNLIKVM